MKLNQKVHLIKKKEKKGTKAIASANNWRANFLVKVFQ